MKRILLQTLSFLFTLIAYGQIEESIKIEYNESDFIERSIPDELYQSGYRSHMEILGMHNDVLVIKEQIRIDRTTHFYTTKLRIHYYNLKTREFVKSLELYDYSDPGGMKVGRNMTSAQSLPNLLFFKGTVYSIPAASKDLSEYKKSQASEITMYTFEKDKLSTRKMLFHTGKYPYRPNFSISNDSSYLYMKAERVLDLEKQKNYKKGILFFNEDLEVTKYIATNLEVDKISFANKENIIWLLQTDVKTKKYPEILVYRLNIEDGNITEESTYKVHDEYSIEEADFLPIDQKDAEGLYAFDASTASFIIGESCKECKNKVRFFSVDIDLLKNKSIIKYSKISYSKVDETANGRQIKFQTAYLESFENQDYRSDKIYSSMEGFSEQQENFQLGDLTYERVYNGSYTELYSKYTLLLDSTQGYMFLNVLNFNPREAGDYFKHSPCVIDKNTKYISLLSNFTVPKVEDEKKGIQMREYYPQVLQLLKINKELNTIERYNIEGDFQEPQKNWTFYTGETFLYNGTLNMLVTTPNKLGVASLSW